MRKATTLSLFFCLLTASLLAMACTNPGTKLTYKKGELYYTSNVTEADAKKVGEYFLKENYFVDEEERAVQLDKSGDTYQVRMVVKEGIDKDEKYVPLFRQVANEISKNIFGGSKVEVQLTDGKLKTLKVIPMG
jgi:hypothetical protein